MNYRLPHTIENCIGERIVFTAFEPTAEGGRLSGEAFCQPGCGPIMHTHFRQDEGLTVISGKMGYQVKGEAPCFAEAGEEVIFKRGVPHRFWAAGSEPLHCKAWVEPANTFLFYISSIYAAQNKSGRAQPEVFDGAYLVRRYAKEYDLADLPFLVKKVVIPLTYFLGRLLGKYRHFRDTPAPLE